MADGQRVTGTVKWFNTDKGYGFISPDDGGEDLFVHHSSIQSSGFRGLSDGQPVEFAVDSGPDGRPRAVEVTGPEGASLALDSRRGGGGACYTCGEAGHMARDCREAGDRRGGGFGGGECFNCGLSGHMARDCRDGNGGGGGRRSGGGFDGGFGGRGGGACYSCGMSGHLARDCGESGGGRSGGGRGCYNCGEQGHFARDCPQAAS